MKLTEIQLLKNTPFTDLVNTIHFASENERDQFFNNHYDKITFENKFDMVKDRLTIQAPLSPMQTYGVNYARFRSEYDNNKWYYCFVTNCEYVNDRVMNVYMMVDTVMTFLQGDFTPFLSNVQVLRQSLNRSSFSKYKDYLLTNSDVLKFPKRYRYQSLQGWKEQCVIFTSSVSLASDFGTEDDPKLRTSAGQTYDSVVSPVDLYLCATQSVFSDIMSVLSNYPWISQNINNVAIVPADMVDNKDFEPFHSDKTPALNESGFYQLKEGGKTKTQKLDKISCTLDQINERLFGDKNVPEFVKREEYGNLTLTDWSGQTVNYNPAFLPSDGLQIYGQSTFGYHNEIRVFADRYQSDQENSIDGLWRGSYTMNGLIFNQFDDIPVLVDNYKLSYAQSAHQRALANSKTISGRINQITSPNTSIKDKIYNSVALTTSLYSKSPLGVASNAVGMLGNEYEYYRQQKAELEDKAITAPTVGSQNNSQAFNIAKGIYGVTVKYQSISENDIQQVIKYHALFGFEFKQVVPVAKVDSCKKCNYLQCTGNFSLKNVPSTFMPQLKATLENGVRFWKNNDTENPFGQSLHDNFN